MGEGMSEGAPFVVDSKGNVDNPADHGDLKAASEAENRISEARSVANRLVKGRIAEIDRKTGPLTSDEQNLRDIDTFRTGNSRELYESLDNKIPLLGDGLQVTSDGGSEVRVLALAGDQEVDGERVFSCYIEGEDKPVPIKGSALATAHMAQRADSIARVFKTPDGTDTPESEVVSWLAKGGTEAPPPPDKVTTIEEKINASEAAESDPRNIAAGVIREQIKALRKEINNAPEGTDLDTQNRLVAQLEAAQVLAGSGVENLAIAGALISLGADRVDGLDELIANLEPGMLEEYIRLEDDLLKAGLNEAELELIKTQGLKLDPENAGLIKKIAGMENWEKVLGPGVSKDQLMGLLEATLTPHQQKWWAENRDKLGGGAWMVLVALLIAPAVVALAGAGVATGLAGAGKNR